jgi:hypothetical protein
MIRICLVCLWSPFVVQDSPGAAGDGWCGTKPSGGQDILLFPDVPYTIIPPSPSDVLCAKQTQFLDGPKGMLTADGEKSYDELDLQKASEKQSQFPPGGHMAVARAGCPWYSRPRQPCYSWALAPMLRMAPNKPNSCPYADPEIGVPGRANRAKRSQFRGSGWDGRAKRAKQSQTWASRGVWGTGQGDEPRADASNKPNSRRGRLGTGPRERGPIARNKPNLRGQMCKTKPISAHLADRGVSSPLPYAGVTLQVRPPDNPVAWAAVVE